jgi:hypothetical protein
MRVFRPSCCVRRICATCTSTLSDYRGVCIMMCCICLLTTIIFLLSNQGKGGGYNSHAPAQTTLAGARAAKAAEMAAALENSYSYSFEDADQSMSEERKQHDARDYASAASHNTHSTHRSSESSHHASSHPGVAAVSSSKIGATDPAAQLRDRARVLNPVRESLAHSLLASQVPTASWRTAAHIFALCSYYVKFRFFSYACCVYRLKELFKSQLESLRSRISATNTYTDVMQQRLSAQWDELNTGVSSSVNTASGSSQSTQDAAHALLFNDLNRSSFTAAPSLSVLRGQMETHRAASADRMLEVLAEVYPNMTVAEARSLVAKL